MSTEKARDEFVPDRDGFYDGADFFGVRTANCGRCGVPLPPGKSRITGGHWKSYNGKIVSASFCGRDCIDFMASDNSGCYGPWVKALGIIPEIGCGE